MSMETQTNPPDAPGHARSHDNFDIATASTRKQLSEGSINGEVESYIDQNEDEKDCICTKQHQVNCKKTVSDLNGVNLRSSSHISEFEVERSSQPDVSEVKSSVTQPEEEDKVAEIQAKESCTTAIEYVAYESERQMEDIMALITKDLSEPYSVYTYRYFIHNWPRLCFLAMSGECCVGAIVCKIEMHKNMMRRGYIAMLAVEKEYRRNKIGSSLVMRAIKAMIEDNCDEVVLETEVTNKGALGLYENLGFVRDKRLFRYYLNGVDALRLKLWLK